MREAVRFSICLLGLAAFSMAGCSPPTSNSNGDSGTLISTLTKLANADENIGALNSAELQILVTQLPALAEQLPQLSIQLPPGMTLPELDDQEAEALEQCLTENNVSTFEDLSDLAEAVVAGTIQIPGILLDDFEAFAAQFGRPRPD
jgi:hypothetical protein